MGGCEEGKFGETGEIALREEVIDVLVYDVLRGLDLNEALSYAELLNRILIHPDLSEEEKGSVVRRSMGENV